MEFYQDNDDDFVPITIKNDCVKKKRNTRIRRNSKRKKSTFIIPQTIIPKRMKLK